MHQLRLATRNIAGNSFRSWMVFFCAALMAGFVIAATLVIRGVDDSLHLALDRLGADIIVIPEPAALLLFGLGIMILRRKH